MRYSLSLLLIATALVAEGEDCEPAVDADQDGWITCSTDQDQLSGVCDCDDSNALIYPGAKETNSKYDDDCDGAPEWTSFEGLDQYYDFSITHPMLVHGGLIATINEAHGIYLFDQFGDLIAVEAMSTLDGRLCSTAVTISLSGGEYEVSGATNDDDGSVDICSGTFDLNMKQYDSWSWGQQLAQYSCAAVQATNGDVLIAGLISDSFPERQNGPLVLRLTPQNELTWSQIGHKPHSLFSQAITEAPSGAILVGGWTYLTSAGPAVPWAERLSADGVLEREWVDWMELPILPSGMLTPWDGDIVLYGTDEDGCFAVGRFTEDLDPIWLWQRPSGECSGVANAGVETFTGDLAIVGAQSDGSGGWCGLAYVLSPFGEMLIESRPCQRDGFFGVVQMPDGGFVMTGQTDYKEGFILRMDKYLNVPPGSTPK